MSERVDTFSCESSEFTEAIGKFLVDHPLSLEDFEANAIRASAYHLKQIEGRILEMFWCDDTGDEDPVCESLVKFELPGLACFCPGEHYRGFEIIDGALVSAQEINNIVVRVRTAF